MQMCLAIIKNMPEEKLKAAEEMLMKMATADGSIDPRENNCLNCIRYKDKSERRKRVARKAAGHSFFLW